VLISPAMPLVLLLAVARWSCRKIENSPARPSSAPSKRRDN